MVAPPFPIRSLCVFFLCVSSSLAPGSPKMGRQGDCQRMSLSIYLSVYLHSHDCVAAVLHGGRQAARRPAVAPQGYLLGLRLGPRRGRRRLARALLGLLHPQPALHQVDELAAGELRELAGRPKLLQSRGCLVSNGSSSGFKRSNDKTMNVSNDSFH